jgi:hypothetical protein
MPYRVATVTTPLWADHQRTLKKGIVSGGVEFLCVEGFQDMLKTSSVQYVPKGAVNPPDWALRPAWKHASRFITPMLD